MVDEHESCKFILKMIYVCVDGSEVLGMETSIVVVWEQKVVCARAAGSFCHEV